MMRRGRKIRQLTLDEIEKREHEQKDFERRLEEEVQDIGKLIEERKKISDDLLIALKADEVIATRLAKFKKMYEVLRDKAREKGDTKKTAEFETNVKTLEREIQKRKSGFKRYEQ